MADIETQSLLDHGGGFGIGYRPVGSPVSPRYTVKKLITNNGNGTATVTLTVTVKTNHGFIGTGYYLTLNFSCGGKSVSSLWKGDQASWAKNSTYSKSISITNVPLGTSTVASASLSVTIGKQSWQEATTGFTFNSTTYSGNQITGLPLGYTAAKFNSASNFTSTASSITVSITGGSSGTATKVAVSIGSTTIKTTSAVTGNITSISLDAADQTRIHNAVPNSTTATVTFVMTTQRSTSDATVVGTATKTSTVTIASSVVPTLSGLTASETGNRGTLKDNNFAVTHSRIKFTMGTQTAGTGAWISSRKITFNGTTYDGSTATTGAIGTSGNITATATITDSRGRTASSSVVCTMHSVPAHSFTSMSGFTHTDNGIPVTITQNSSLVYADVSLWLGGTHLGTQSVTYSTTAFTLTSSMKSSLLSRIPTSSATVTLLAVSYLGGAEIGRTSRTATCSIASSIVPAKPVVSVTDTNSKVTGLGLGAGYFVQGLSTVSLSMSNIAAGSGATVSSRTISYSSSSYSYSSGSLPVGTPNTVGNISISGTVTDSRGRSTKSDTITREVLGYTNPSLSGLNIFRSTSGGVADNGGTKMRINHTLRCHKLLGKNSLTLEIRVKNSSSNTWPTTPTYTNTWAETVTPPSNTVLTATYPIDQSYDVQITVTDKAGRSVAAIGKLPTSEYPLVLGPNNVGIGKIPNAAYTLDVGGNARIDGNLTVNGGTVWHSANDTPLRTGRHGNYYQFYVGGSANTYYPVLISSAGNYGFNRYTITRHYNWAAPDTWNTPTHRGGLTFTYDFSGDSSWGGNDKTYRIIQFNESYTTMVAGMGLSTSGMFVYLRGGNALYELQTEAGKGALATVHLTTFTDARGIAYAPRTTVSNVTAEILNYWPVRNGSTLRESNNVVWHDGNVTKAKITALGIPGQDTNTTYGVATTGANGLMSAADKVKLNGIATGATADPTTHGSGNNISYRFANGLQISVIKISHNSQNINAAWGSLYESGTKNGIAYSVPFVADPSAAVSVGGTNHCFVSYNGGTASICPHYALLRPTASTGGNYTVKIIAVGRWK